MRVVIGGVPLYAEVAGAGQGDAVLLLHGGFCSLESLQAQGEALAADHEVHAFERAGHGRSADVEGEYSYERGLADTLEYLDAAGLAAASGRGGRGGRAGVHVIGYSDGAIIGLMLAMRHPERVRSLVAISANLDPSAFAHDGEVPGAVVLRAPHTPAPKPGSDAGPEPGPDTEPEPDREREAYDRLSPDGPGHGDEVLAKLFRLWTSAPRIHPAELAAIEAPTLVMAADRDSIRLDHTLLIASSIPGAQLCIVPGASHGLVAERPAFIAGVIRDFLSSLG